ncbi:YigZ family protein [Facklamia sp. DSM 111018]|uniref:YigZ family protein n=1 Tax=Facklamia lactis TaxID=2749967 RepID=A0ABS0LSU5_9LACT|nr:YigZ family protein [Facklamia lactis]MBG9981440.1 YigZ family protein [Facklamia lactis]MBG9987084.1 YigZ family protein [Facklamia lactis]
MINFKSILEPTYYEIEIKKSRFIGFLFPIQDEFDANEELQRIRKKHYKATHHCYAYILGENSSIQRYSDDGEPSGTAGIPILEVLKQNNLTNILAIVVRYYGGIKLGSGGLIRAYSESISSTLQQATLSENTHQLIINITLNYAQNDTFQYEIAKMTNGPTIIDVQYTDQVEYTCAFFEETASDFEAYLTNRFKGQISWKIIGSQAINIPITK